MPARKKQGQDDGTAAVDRAVQGDPRGQPSSGAAEQQPTPTSPRRSGRLASPHTSPAGGAGAAESHSPAPASPASAAQQHSGPRGQPPAAAAGGSTEAAAAAAAGEQGQQPAAAGGESGPLPPPLPEQQQQLGGGGGAEGQAATAAAAGGMKPAEPEESPEEKAACLKREDAIIKQARAIRKARDVKLPPVWQGPKQGRLHWDALLEEMAWLAKEFQKERAWKLKQARRFAGAAQRSNMDVESRVLVRQREEEKALRKRAAWMAKEVMNFWGKAQRVVQYKVKTEFEAKKKEVMDKQLDFLLGQTQKYSTMLAERLVKDESGAGPATAAGHDQQQQQAQQAGTAAGGSSAAAGTSAQHAQQSAAAGSRAASGVVGGAGAYVGASSEDGYESADYRSGQDDDADDEATLEEEERLAAAEAGGADLGAVQKAEAAGLAEDADLPLEQLLERYGYVVPSDGDQVMEEGEASMGAASEAGGEEGSDGEGAAASDADSEHGTGALLEVPAELTPAEAEHAARAAAGPSRLAAELADVESEEEEEGAGGAAGAGPSGSGDGAGAGSGSDAEGDYRSGQDDDADDEATLEEEERLAAAEAGGADLGAVQKAEAAGLAEDADVPLEQLLPPELLARYGFAAASPKLQQQQPGPSAAAGPSAQAQRAQQALQQASSDDDDDEEEEAGPSAPSRLAAELADVDSDGEEQAGAGASQDGTEDGEADYRSGQDDDADDEATLEEEERLAAAEAGGADLGAVQKAEAAGLAEDADVPLEQLLPPELLARYGFAAALPEQQQQRQGESPSAAPSPLAAAKSPAAQQALQGHQAVEVKQEPKEEQEPPAQRSAQQAAPSPAVRPTKVEAPSDDEDENAPQGIEDAMAAMAGLQPLGSTLDTAKVKTKPPFLLKGQLREYQHIGLDWLVTLYQKRLNGILADEMGLGKTIQTIALLAHLACEKGDWGPHLVVVPTSVMLNWEMEFKKWCPAFKLLTYYGGVKERAAKRQGWSKPNAFHVCITSYTLVLQDARMFKRKKWKYLILDEAHMIKNWKSQRWQTLLNFNSKRRLLITGTPLQNDLMELWSLMHFLMPQVFASHAQFKDWFSNPLTGMVEGSAEMNRAIVERLHSVLRPFLLRRLKKDVEKQLPQKHEHVLYCRLSKRQRQLYEEYMHNSDTRATLSSGNFLGIMNCLMQLRKVCNHPDLFEGRAIVSAYDMEPLPLPAPRDVLYATRPGPFDAVDRRQLGLLPAEDEGMARWEAAAIAHLALLQQAFSQPATAPQEDVQLLFRSAEELAGGSSGGGAGPGSLLQSLPFRPNQSSLQAVIASIQAVTTRRRLWRRDRTLALGTLSTARTARRPLYGWDLVRALWVEQPVGQVHEIAAQPGRHLEFSSALRDAVKLPAQRAAELDETLRAFCFVIPKARAAPPVVVCSRPDLSVVNTALRQAAALQQEYMARNALLHVPRIRTQLFFPDRRLIQFDCGKLQELAVLLRKLKAGGHKALIFTQMSKMLDILEVFLNLHAYTYLRLDGSTKPEERQVLMQRFNTDPKLFVFILSTRSGGVGMNLTGADNVIFYDSDWNPAMDAQAQDRCHRIGQTREVHIWRLVSEHTIEENILKKSDQKRQLDWLAIQSGGFTTDAILTKFDPKAILGLAASDAGAVGGKVSDAEVAAAMRAAEDEGDAEAALALEKETAAEMEEFTREPPPQAAGGEEEGEDTAAPSEDRGKTPEPFGAPPAAAPAAPAGAGAGGGEDESMADLVAMTGGASGSDALAQLESALRPVEKYAVRLLEAIAPGPDKEALERQVEATYKVEELDIDQIEREEEEREADIDEDSEQNLVVDWDQSAADEAYKAQVEAAQREEEERVAAEQAWLEEYNAMLAQNALVAQEASAAAAASWGAAVRAKGGKGWVRGRAGGYESADTTASGGRVRGRQGSPGIGIKEEEEEEEEEELAGWGVKRQRGAAEGGEGSPRSVVGRPFPQPWEPQEDFVLCCVACSQLDSGQQALGPATWQAAAAALGSGACASSMAGVDPAAAQGRKRGAQVCQQRYSQLAAAYRAAATGSTAPLAPALLGAQALLLQWLAGAGGGPGGAASQQTRQAALGAVQQLVAGPGPLGAALQRLLSGAAPLAPPVQLDPASVTPQEAEAIQAAVRKQMGGGAARGIAARLPAVLDACRQGGAEAGREALLDSFSRPGELPRVASPRAGGGTGHGPGLGQLQLAAQPGFLQFPMQQQQQQQQRPPMPAGGGYPGMLPGHPQQQFGAQYGGYSAAQPAPLPGRPPFSQGMAAPSGPPYGAGAQQQPGLPYSQPPQFSPQFAAQPSSQAPLRPPQLPLGSAPPPAGSLPLPQLGLGLGPASYSWPPSAPQQAPPLGQQQGPGAPPPGSLPPYMRPPPASQYPPMPGSQPQVGAAAPGGYPLLPRPQPPGQLPLQAGQALPPGAPPQQQQGLPQPGSVLPPGSAPQPGSALPAPRPPAPAPAPMGFPMGFFGGL